MEIYHQILNLFENDNEESFNNLAIEVFRTQAIHNPVYRRFLELINCEAKEIFHYRKIPLMPISFFKKYKVQTHKWLPEKIFLSSGTSSEKVRSQHLVKNLKWYDDIATRIFKASKNSVVDYTVLALLPNYLENGASSLVHMVDNFQKLSSTELPASYLYQHKELADRIHRVLEKGNKPILLIGVTYALLDFAKEHPISNPLLKILFTGGMKNKRQEMSYIEIKEELRRHYPESEVFAEYGMTELLSQAYTDSNDNYRMPATMRILIKELQDPQANSQNGKAGVVGIIDLANVDTCSFILTEDLGTRISSRSFSILGRMDNSDLRGCNLLYNSDYNN